jgi:hypothetical protein
MISRSARRGLTVMALCTAAACADSALTGPSLPAHGDRALAQQGSSSTGVVLVLKRSARLRAGLTTSAVIGPRGGKLSIPEAGIRVDFPRGAVNDRLAASLQGSYVGNEFLFDPLGKYARVLEARPGRHNRLGKSLEFSIEHFSGYMVSTGDLGLPFDIDIKITFR